MREISTRTFLAVASSRARSSTGYYVAASRTKRPAQSLNILERERDAEPFAGAVSAACSTSLCSSQPLPQPILRSISDPSPLRDSRRICAIIGVLATLSSRIKSSRVLRRSHAHRPPPPSTAVSLAVYIGCGALAERGGEEGPRAHDMRARFPCKLCIPFYASLSPAVPR